MELEPIASNYKPRAINKLSYRAVLLFKYHNINLVTCSAVALDIYPHLSELLYKEFYDHTSKT